MRYLSMIRLDEKTAKPPTERLMADMGKLMEEMTRAGVLIETAGLRPTAEGFRVRLRDGKLTTVDGPFTESKEVIGGFSIMNLASKAEAIEEARKFMDLHAKFWPEWEADCEVRAMYEDSAAGAPDCGAP